MDDLFKRDIKHLLLNIRDFTDRLCLLNLLVSKSLKNSKSRQTELDENTLGTSKQQRSKLSLKKSSLRDKSERLEQLSTINSIMAKFDLRLQNLCQETYSELIDHILSEVMSGQTDKSWFMSKVGRFEQSMKDMSSLSRLYKSFDGRGDVVGRLLSSDSGSLEDGEGSEQGEDPLSSIIQSGVYSEMLRKRSGYEGQLEGIIKASGARGRTKQLKNEGRGVEVLGDGRRALGGRKDGGRLGGAGRCSRGKLGGVGKVGMDFGLITTGESMISKSE